MRGGLRAQGLWPLPEQAYSQVEGRFVDALPPVSPPPRFRESLASNLDLLAQHRRSGIIVKREPIRPTGMLIGLGIISLGVASVLVMLVILLARLSKERPTRA
ncbi:MAG: hypothetical protein ACYCYF_14940 [Anaerolineae bacterium]